VYGLDQWVAVKQGPTCQKCKVCPCQSSTFHVFFHVYQIDRWIAVKQGPNCQKCKVLFLPSSTFDAFFNANELDQWVAVKQGPKVHSLSPIVHGMWLLHITWGNVVRSPMQNML